MHKIPLMKEPDCWVGPNSILADPEDFPELPEDYFALPHAEETKLAKLYEKRRPNSNQEWKPSEFILKYDKEKYTENSQANSEINLNEKRFREKQNRLSEALDSAEKLLLTKPDSLKEACQEVWKLNNVSSSLMARSKYTTFQE